MESSAAVLAGFLGVLLVVCVVADLATPPADAPDTKCNHDDLAMISWEERATSFQWETTRNGEVMSQVQLLTFRVHCIRSGALSCPDRCSESSQRECSHALAMH
jgi:hypothetical protein